MFVFMSRSSVASAVVFAAALIRVPLLFAADEPLELVPDGADVVAVVQVGAIFASPAFEKATAEFPDLKKDVAKPLGEHTKLKFNQIEKMFVAGNTESMDFVLVMTMKKPVKASDVATDDDVAVEEIGDYELFVPKEDKGFVLIDENVVAIGPAKSLRAVLKRDAEAELDEDLEAAWNEVEEDSDLYVVAKLDGLMKKAAGGLPPGFPLQAEQLAKLHTAALLVDAETKLPAWLDVECEDAATAQQMKQVIDAISKAMVDQGQVPPAVAKILSTMKTSVEENYLSLEAELGIDMILGLVKQQQAAADAAPAPAPAPVP